MRSRSTTAAIAAVSLALVLGLMNCSNYFLILLDGDAEAGSPGPSIISTRIMNVAVGGYTGNITVLYNNGDTRTGTMTPNVFVTLNEGPPPAAADYIVSITLLSGPPIWIGRFGGDIYLNINSAGVLSLRPAAGSGIPIGSYAEFQLVNTNVGTRANSYTQEADLDLLGDAALIGLGVQQEWACIGISGTLPFTGTYDGNGKAITHLYINKPLIDDQGLFGWLNDPNCEVRNVTLSGSVTGNDSVGGIAGSINLGGITGCSNAASVTGNNQVGGVVGHPRSSTTITASCNTGSVTGNDNVGGIVGMNKSITTACYNTGSVSGRSSTAGSVGGLAGFNNSSGTITASYNTGSVSSGSSVGGLAGHNGGTITASYNTGSVSGSATNSGGLAGRNGGTITASYNTGSVSGGSFVGNLVGDHSSLGTIIDCYWRTGMGPGNYKGTGTGTASWPVNGGTGSFTPPPALRPAPVALLAASYPGWGIGNNPSAGLYWKSNYIGRNVGGVQYPALGWE